MPRETSGRRNRRRRRKNKERKTSADDPSDQPKEESECTSELNSIETDECYVENRSIRDDKTTENHPSSSSTSVASTSRPFRPALVKPLPGLKAVLESVGGTAQVFTRSEVMDYLVKYIKTNELYDVHNPRRVHCESDPLGKVFGCKEFSTANVCELLLKNLENVGESGKNQDCFKRQYSRRDSRKRKRLGCCSTDFSSDSDSSFGGLPCSIGFMRVRSCSSSSDSEATIEFPGTPPGSGAEMDSVDSVLYRLAKISSPSYDTTTVTDSEDDLFFLEDDCGGDRFPVEYEPVSEDEDEQNESEVFIFVSDDEDTVVNDDDDYDADTEIGEEDYWNCDRCSYNNHPMTSHCVSCRNVRRNWLPSGTDRSYLHSSTLHIPSLQRSSTAPPSPLTTNPPTNFFPSLPRSTTIGPAPSIVPVSNSDLSGLQRSLSLPSSSVNTELQHAQNDTVVNSNFNLPKEACIVCLNKPRDASIIHGSTGHQVCCIRCAHRIKNSRDPRCPVCRKAIEHIVTNFL